MIRAYLRQAYRTLWPLLYSRSRYKLFLRTSFENIGDQVHLLASLSDTFSNFLRPIPITAPFGSSALIVAPHQDDETIGCGGAMVLQLRAGKAVHIVIVQDGADGHDEIGMERQALTALRNEESRRAAAVVGLEPVFLNHAKLGENIPLIAAQLRDLIESRRVDAVFTPFLLDGHPDHRATNVILAEALRQVDRNIRVLCYEVWGLTIPNVMVVIDSVMDLKRRMLECFTFANQAIDYVHTTEGLNMYRARFLGAGQCRYAECFFEIPRQEFIELVQRVAKGR